MQVINNSQFRFRKERSCATNVLSFYTWVIDEAQGRDGRGNIVYLDVKKVFDRVPHRRLLWKVEHMGGVQGNILNWMRNYLTGREMGTVITDPIKL